MFISTIYVVALAITIFHLKWASAILLYPELFGLLIDALFYAYDDLSLIEFQIAVVALTYFSCLTYSKSHLSATVMSILVSIVAYNLELATF